MTKQKRVETRTTIRIDADLAKDYKALYFGDRLNNNPELIEVLTLTYCLFSMAQMEGFRMGNMYKKEKVTVKVPKTLQLAGHTVSDLLRAYLVLEELEPIGFDVDKTEYGIFGRVLSNLLRAYLVLEERESIGFDDDKTEYNAADLIAMVRRDMAKVSEQMIGNIKNEVIKRMTDCRL